MTSKVHTVRLPPADADRVDTLVERGMFQSRSDFMRYAVKNALQEVVRREAEAELLFGTDEDDAELGTLLDGPGEVPADEDDAAPRKPAGRRSNSR